MPTDLGSRQRLGRDTTARRPARLALRLIGAVLLLISAGVHGYLAPDFGAAQPGLNLGKQFVVQAVLTAAVAIWLLIKDSALAWLIGAVVMAGTAGALLIAHGPGIPAVGPMPAVKELIWDTPQIVTLVAELAFVVVALAWFALRRSRR
jgi:hypothetical protein